MSAHHEPLQQTPAPGAYLMAHRGDTVQITLTLPQARPGQAWLRTNLGNGQVRRREIIAHVEKGQPILFTNWHDIPMCQLDQRRFALTLSLLEVGCFEAKAFFLPQDSEDPVWPEGGNTCIKVEPAQSSCCNTVYSAFVRQFGPGRLPSSDEDANAHQQSIQALDAAGYHVIPQSGTFRDLIKELDHIVGTLRCRILQLLPIHPTPTTYARMGRFGSPFAAMDFLDVDPSLAEFDRQTTPLDQFRELVDAVHARNARIFLDIPANHTGWASYLQTNHPEWFARNHDRSFQSPGAWGVTWEDLSELDYGNRDLWPYMASVFLHWCRQGVDGFRCDAGYMIPYPVWEYIVAKVRDEYPDTIFLLEGLGGKISTMEALLAGADLNWAYSELFQNYDQNQIDHYLPDCNRIAASKGLLIHFAETHDNDRLAARSHSYARLRTALAAMCSHNGAFGITNGVEWYADAKIDVHGAPSLNWGSRQNQIDLIARLNAVTEVHPAFHPGTDQQLIHRGHHNSIALLRLPPNGGTPLLILANLNHTRPGMVVWPPSPLKHAGKTMTDLISGRLVEIDHHKETYSCPLAPGEVLCLTANHADLQEVKHALNLAVSTPERAIHQQLRAKALEVYHHYRFKTDVSQVEADELARQLTRDPRAFCARLRGEHLPPALTTWQWPRDLKRTVMIPPGHFLYVQSQCRFSAELCHGNRVCRREIGLPAEDGGYFALMSPLGHSDLPRHLTLRLTAYEPGQCRHAEAPILNLDRWQNSLVQRSFQPKEIVPLDCHALCTNGRGAMAQISAAWGHIRSRYDALLAGNLSADYPVDRHIMFTRCRGWLIYRGYSLEINQDCLRHFWQDDEGTVVWTFAIPVGMGKQVPLEIRLRMREDCNSVELAFERPKAKTGPDFLDDSSPVTLILRPDIEDRCCHETTKAYLGPEQAWPAAVTPAESGFTFAPAADRRLRVKVPGGAFTSAPEWSYMINHPIEADRGLEDRSDLFSPGYFSLPLKSSKTALLKADILAADQQQVPASSTASPKSSEPAPGCPLSEGLVAAMRQFIVKRDDSRTVIAGYPWFLDWGRDTLICLRGMISAGFLTESRDILRQFARFEKQGTIPNMIRGNDDANRETSDAPLWFFTACADLLNAEGDSSLLQMDCGGRPLQEVLHSIATHYRQGTPNGIRMDPASGLVYSPSHYTWMDTNYPAGTPRQGYPVEIQALWHAALQLMARLFPKEDWQALADTVRGAIERFYWSPQRGYLSDCLHATPGQSAQEATADDALRSNQLLAITLGAVKDNTVCAAILAACEELLVPGAIRSLADRPVAHPLPVVSEGRLLNDPHNPYWGHYRQDEDTRRKPAYHNGTAWTWPFPSYAEALFQTFGEPCRNAALAILSSSTEIINRGCVGQVPEIVDGDAPHTLRGCGAQAWGATELYRALAILNPSNRIESV